MNVVFEVFSDICFAIRSISLWGAAFVCWVSDRSVTCSNIGAHIALTSIFSRFFCEFWSGLGFPYLHGAWYITSIPSFVLSFEIIICHHYTSIITHDQYDRYHIDRKPLIKTNTMSTCQF